MVLLIELDINTPKLPGYSKNVIFEGYAVFDIQEKKKATDKSIEKAKEPSTAESEEKSYEQQTLFPSTNMY